MGDERSRDAITNLIFEYAERIDAGDLDGVADMFAEGEITAEGSDAGIRGRDAVRDMYRTTKIYPETGTPRTKHVTTNLIIDVDDDAGTATARSYFTVLQQTATLPLQPVIAGRYHDTFARVDGRWRFKRRHMICDLFGDLSQHLTQDFGPRG
jgi:ketosteroid isomerase-like protein